jgi:V8-like Glu-specific endopeptidase
MAVRKLRITEAEAKKLVPDQGSLGDHLKNVFAGIISLFFSMSVFALNIYGHDDRIPMTNTQQPWSAIGRLRSSPDARGMIDICTATLVENDVILTAAHCFFDKGTVKNGDFFFQPMMVNGASPVTAHVISVVYDTRYPSMSEDQAIGHDWALAKLDQDLGSAQGTIPVYDADPFLLSNLTSTEKAITLVGYSGDYNDGKTATISKNCSVRKSGMGSIMYHDCSMTPGASGGPLLIQTRDDKWVVVGVNVAERVDSAGHEYHDPTYADSNANLAVSSVEFFGQWKKLIDGQLPERYNSDGAVAWAKLSAKFALTAWATKSCSASPSKVVNACRSKAEEFVANFPMPLSADALVSYRAGLILSVCQVPNRSNSGIFGRLWSMERRQCFSRATTGSDNPFTTIHKLCSRGGYACYVHELENVVGQMR